MSKRKGSSPPDTSGGSVSDFGGDGSRVVLVKIGELSSDVKTLIKTVDQLAAETADLKKKAIEVSTAVKVGGVLILGFFGLFWYFFGNHVNAVVENAVREVTQTAPQSRASIPTQPKPGETASSETE